jgi:hypothetical protein
MFSALYYPHTGIQSPALMKQALLLWDQIEYIAPDRYFRPYYSSTPKPGRDAHTPAQATQMQQAMELIGQPYVPTTEEKKAAHKTILGIAHDGIPARIANATGIYFSDYEIYKNKLLPETWEELGRLKLGEIRRHGNVDDFVVHTPFGLLMMAVLTDCCIGTQACKITDRGAAYVSIADALQQMKMLTPVSNKTSKSKTLDKAKTRRLDSLRTVRREEDEQATQEYVVTTTLRTVDVEHLQLKDLVKLRTREKKESGHWLGTMRKTYAAKVAEYTQSLLAARNSKDLKAIDRQLDASLEDDLKLLRAELKNTAIGFVKNDLLVSVTAGSLGNAALLVTGVSPLVAAGVGIVGLTAQFSDYRHKRNKTLEQHPLGYLYATKSLTLY